MTIEQDVRNALVVAFRGMFDVGEPSAEMFVDDVLKEVRVKE